MGNSGMSDQILEQLFESPAKVRLFRLFLRDPKAKLTAQEARARIQVDARTCKNTLEGLKKAGFLKVSYRKKPKPETIYFSNPHFMFLDELRDLVLKSSPTSKTRLLNRIKGLGRIQLLVLSGIFLRPDRELSRTDLLVVGDDISQKHFENFLRQLEAEAGCEIQYSLISSEEFRYRRKMMDRFLRDILERPHEKLIDKIGV